MKEMNSDQHIRAFQASLIGKTVNILPVNQIIVVAQWRNVQLVAWANGWLLLRKEDWKVDVLLSESSVCWIEENKDPEGSNVKEQVQR